jgi:Zn-dependent alcohol dehydrogenase
MRIQASVLHTYGQPLEVCELELDPPGPGEVLVRVAAAGICHSDLHLADGHLGPGRHPMVLGHEGAGIVERVGEDVNHVAPGDPVAFCLVPACGRCRACAAGRRTLCETAAAAAWAGTLLDGTSRLRFPGGAPVQHFNFLSCYATHCVVPAGSAVPIPAALPLWQAALLGCGVVTAVGAVRNTARVGAGDSVCVVGCGGVGLQLVAAARLAGAGRIIAVDRNPASLELAVARGATATIAADGDAAGAVLAASDGGVDHAFEAVGSPATIRLAWDVLRPGATAIVVGVTPAGAEVALPAFELLSEKGLRGSYYGSGDAPALIAAMAELVLAGRFPVADMVGATCGLDGIEDAFERLRHGAARARTIALIDAQLAGGP